MAAAGSWWACATADRKLVRRGSPEGLPHERELGYCVRDRIEHRAIVRISGGPMAIGRRGRKKTTKRKRAGSATKRGKNSRKTAAKTKGKKVKAKARKAKP